MNIDSVQDFQFTPDLLQIGKRRPGLSAFVRVRNGEDFLAEAVCSHIEFFDEIVIVFNQCTDKSEQIVRNLITAYPQQIKAYHYLDPVYPPGHTIYRNLDQRSPNSIGTYYNFALSKTTRTVATKLDDDHIAIPQNVENLIGEIKSRRYSMPGQMLCFSGLNLVSIDSQLQIYKSNPFGGNGDHGFFNVSPHTWFTHTEKFEVFNRRGLTRKFGGMTYLHYKYLKKNFGFDNYDLQKDPRNRYSRHLKKFHTDQAGIDIDTLVRITQPHILYKLKLPGMSDKLLLKSARAENLKHELANVDLATLHRNARKMAEHIRVS